VTVRLQADVSTVDTDDGMVLLDERAGRYWQLNRTGAVVLRLLLDGATSGEVGQALAERQPVNIEQAGADVADLVQRLRAAGLVTEHPGRRT